MSKLECFTLKPPSENSLGSDSLCTIVNSWHKQGTSMKETLCLDLLPKSTSLELLSMPLTNRELPVISTSLEECISLSCTCSFSAGTLPGNTLGINLPIQARPTFSAYKSKNISLSHPPRKHLGCWFSLHYNPFLMHQMTFLKETLCLHLLLGAYLIKHVGSYCPEWACHSPHK